MVSIHPLLFSLHLLVFFVGFYSLSYVKMRGLRIIVWSVCAFQLQSLTLKSASRYVDNLKRVQPAAKNQIRVLCFGASITAGFSAGGLHYYPYATRLSARLADELPTSHFSINVDGSPGDTMLHGQYINRMNRDMANATIPYDWVIIQAGGNDLAWNATPEAIYEKMQEVWDIPLKTGAKVLALTITEHAHANAQQKAKMEMLNGLVDHHHQDSFYVAHVARAIPWTGMDEEERKKIWGMSQSASLQGMCAIRNLDVSANLE